MFQQKLVGCRSGSYLGATQGANQEAAEGLYVHNPRGAHVFDG